MVKRRRFRFTLKLLLSLPLIVAAYLALGPATNSLGVKDVGKILGEHNGSPTAMAPLLLKHSVIHVDIPVMSQTTHYYFWFFGFVAKLPYKRQVQQDFPAPDVHGRLIMQWTGLPPIQIPRY